MVRGHVPLGRAGHGYLSTRLDQHLRDRHGAAWDAFSVYLTIGDGHMREIESLLMRIATPGGNTQRGRLAHSEDLVPELRRQYRDRARVTEQRLFNPGARPAAKRSAQPTGAANGAAPKPGVLAKYIDGPMRLRARYKGKTYRATVRRDGWIRFLGQVFRAPSGAAHALLRRPVTGWGFWECERARGDWVKLSELRRQGHR